MKIPDIASQIVVWTADPTSRDEFLRKRFWIYDELYFDHVPILSEHRAVTYYQEDDMVTLGPKKKYIVDIISAKFESELEDLTESEETSFYNWL